MGIKAVHRDLPGCLPIRGAGVIHEAVPDWYRICRGKMGSVFNYAKKGHIAYVVLAGRWSLYTRNTRLGETGDRGEVFIGIGEDDERSSERSQQIFKKRMRSTIAGLVKSGKKIIIFGQVPNIGFDPGRCLYLPGYLDIDYAGCKPLDKAHALENIAFTNKVLAMIAKSYPEQVLFLEAGKVFCPEDKCIYISDKTPYYGDSNHLLAAGSHFLIDHYSAQLREFIQGG
jgi:hypothetical protein